MVYRLETFIELAKLVHLHCVRILSKSCQLKLLMMSLQTNNKSQLKLLMMSLQTNNKIVHVMTAKLSVGFNSDITRQIKMAFFPGTLAFIEK